MAIEILGTGQPDGTGVVKATTEKVHLYGGTPVAQAVSIASIAVTGNTSDNINTAFAFVNTLLSDLADLGIIASA